MFVQTLRTSWKSVISSLLQVGSVGTATDSVGLVSVDSCWRGMPPAGQLRNPLLPDVLTSALWP